jgi:hypothetical protein
MSGPERGPAPRAWVACVCRPYGRSYANRIKRPAMPKSTNTAPMLSSLTRLTPPAWAYQTTPKETAGTGVILGRADCSEAPVGCYLCGRR